jgi:hypothetical protein
MRWDKRRRDACSSTLVTGRTCETGTKGRTSELDLSVEWGGMEGCIEGMPERIDQGYRITHCNPSWNKIDLVQNVNQVLVRLLLPDVLDDRLTPRSDRISRIEDVDDHV